MSSDAIQSLLTLSHELGGDRLRMAILGEGNTSVRLDDDTFAVKASGSNLATLTAADVTSCAFDRLLPLLDKTTATDVEVDQALLAARLDPAAKKPSIEALFHAYLLTRRPLCRSRACHRGEPDPLLAARPGVRRKAGLSG